MPKRKGPPVSPYLLLRLQALAFDIILAILGLALGLFLLEMLWGLTPLNVWLVPLAVIGIYAYFETAKQATGGKRSLGLEVVRETSTSETAFVWFFLRNFVKYFKVGWGLFFVLWMYVQLLDQWVSFEPLSWYGICAFLALGLLGVDIYLLKQKQTTLHDLLAHTEVHYILDADLFPGQEGETVPNAKKHQSFNGVWTRVVMIIGLLGLVVLIALPNFIPSQDRNCNPDDLMSIKGNMHTLQTMVETYGVDWNGLYPPHIQALEQDAKISHRGNYWKTFKNPVSGYEGYGKSYANEGETRLEGIVTYEVSRNQTAYFIYGYRDKEMRTQDQGQDFILSNS